MPTSEPTSQPSTFRNRNFMPGLHYQMFNGYFNDDVNFINSAPYRNGLLGTSSGFVSSINGKQIGTGGNAGPGEQFIDFTIMWTG